MTGNHPSSALLSCFHCKRVSLWNWVLVGCAMPQCEHEIHPGVKNQFQLQNGLNGFQQFFVGWKRWLCSGPGEEARVWRKPHWLYCHNFMLYKVQLYFGVFWLHRSLTPLRSFPLSSWHGFSILILGLFRGFVLFWIWFLFLFLFFCSWECKILSS